MEPFCVIIPNRPGREVLYENCMRQISQMTTQPDRIYNIDYPSISEEVDISERVLSGIELAKKDGIDLCFIIENDDAYPTDYFERFGEMKEDFFGCETTYYYHIGNRTWQEFIHKNRSSLFTTGFRISAIEGFQLPSSIHVDVELWKHTIRTKAQIKFIPESGAIGIKGHGSGKSGGKGHKLLMKNNDLCYSWLKTKVDKQNFEFFTNL